MGSYFLYLSQQVPLSARRVGTRAPARASRGAAPWSITLLTSPTKTEKKKKYTTTQGDEAKEEAVI